MRTLRVQGTTDLVVLAAVLQQCRALLTGDTGPMHLAAAVGTPVLAVFGPSMPWRYGPLVEPSRVVRVDLPCSPCNRIRLPPERCQGHTPDCLAEVHVEAVVAAGRSLLASSSRGAPRGRGERARGRDERRAGERSISTSLLDADAAERAEASANQWIKQPAPRARRRRQPARSVHTSRRFALVVRRDLPASDAGRHAERTGRSPRSSARTAGLRRALVRRWRRIPWWPRRASGGRASRHRVRGPGRSRCASSAARPRAQKRCFTPPPRWPTGCDPRLRPHARPSGRGVRPLGLCRR